MEIALVVLLFIPYLIIKYYVTDHDTPAEKDRKCFQEGIELYDSKNFEEAFHYFDQKVRAFPKSAIAYAYRGKCNKHDENYYSAIYDLSQAISFDNTLAECYLEKGKAHYSLAEYKEAFKEFDKAVWFYRNANPEAVKSRGMARLRMQQFVQSERDFLRAVELGDEDARFILSQAPFYKTLLME